jgi:hypothetical protein
MMSTLSTPPPITALSRMILPTSLLFVAYCQVVVGLVVVTAVSQDSNSSCPSQEDSAWSIFLLQAVIYLSGTIETWVRAFCFGFGVHILMYLVMVNPNATFEALKGRMNVSLTAGVAFACVVYGGSMVSYRNRFYQRKKLSMRCQIVFLYCMLLPDHFGYIIFLIHFPRRGLSFWHFFSIVFLQMFPTSFRTKWFDY